MKKMFKINLALLFVVFLSLSSVAEVKLSGALTGNMVLQREKPITIWGWADKGEKITAVFNNVKKSTKADASGAWKVVFPALPAGGPYTLQVKGKNVITLDNILMGDVWICSGQSNMGVTMRDVNESAKEIAAADYPNIRLFDFPRSMPSQPAADSKGGNWKACSPDNVKGFSAVAYFFGRDVYKEINVPIGLIHTSWGGSNAEAWTSMDWLVKLDKYKNYPQVMAEKLKKTDSLTLASLKHPNGLCTSLYNGMIHPLLNLAVKGVIWYQGESNAYEGKLYQTMFPNLIECWREKWHQPDMPFLYVQLANYMDEPAEPGKSNWASLREAQMLTLSHPNVGMAVAVEIGEAKNIHPRNKQDVGYRLAVNALHLVYGKDIAYSGPIYKSMVVEGNKAVISFNHSGSGLMAKDKYGYPKAFAIAGADQKFVWARAEIQGDKVVVFSDKISRPVAVRYAWADNPGDANLYNKEGLPASPFRTDNW